MVADGDILDVAIGQVSDIVYEFYEEEEVAKDLGVTIGDVEGNYLSAAVTGRRDAKRMEKHLL